MYINFMHIYIYKFGFKLYNKIFNTIIQCLQKKKTQIFQAIPFTENETEILPYWYSLHICDYFLNKQY